MLDLRDQASGASEFPTPECFGIFLLVLDLELHYHNNSKLLSKLDRLCNSAVLYI